MSVISTKYNKIKKNEFKLLDYQVLIMNLLLEKELLSEKKYTNFWFKAMSGIGKSTVICEMMKQNHQDKTLIICNKWNVLAWKKYIERINMKCVIVNDETFYTTDLNGFSILNDKNIDYINNISTNLDYNIFLILDTEIDNMLKYLTIADLYWDRIIMDKMIEMKHIPEYDICWIISDLSDHMDDHLNDIFYKKFNADYELIELPDEILKQIENKFTTKLMNYTYDNIIFDKKLMNSSNYHLNPRVNNLIIVNSEDDYNRVVKLLGNSKYITLDLSCNQHDINNAQYKYGKYINNLILFNDLNLNSISFIATDNIFIYSDNVDVKQCIGRCLRISNKKLILNVFQKFD